MIPALQIALSIIAAIGWLWILRLAYPEIRKAESRDRRVWLMTAVGLLTLLSAMLLLTALYDLSNPPPPDAVRQTFGITFRAILAISGVLLIKTWPRR